MITFAMLSCKYNVIVLKYKEIFFAFTKPPILRAYSSRTLRLFLQQVCYAHLTREQVLHQGGFEFF